MVSRLPTTSHIKLPFWRLREADANSQCPVTRLIGTWLVRDVMRMCLRGKPSDTTGMTKLIFSALLVFLLVLPTVASDQEDKAADAVAAAFIQARQAAHLSKLERMGRNTFRQRACEQDMRMPSGWINEVVYQTVDPAHLPESAQQLASRPDGYKTAARFGIGVCLLTSSPGERPRFSVLIAIYESRWTSFLRIFWE
jgi:hypothetical protein